MSPVRQLIVRIHCLSNLGAPAGGIQAAGQNVSLNLPVPLFAQKFVEPLREAVEFLARSWATAA